MNTKIINVDKKPAAHSKLFFGEYSGLARIDTIQYAQFKKLYESSESNTWFMNELSYTADITGWKEIPVHAQRMFKLNICYQTLMDSSTTKIFSEIAKVSSLSEIQYLYSRISIEENIHALSYSNALATVFGSEAEDMLDLVYSDNFVKNRMINEVDGSEVFLELCINNGKMTKIKRKLKNMSPTNAFSLLKDINDIVFDRYVETEAEIDEAKKSLLMLLGASFLLEGIKFPFSFFVTWSINKAYDNNIQGMARLIKLIAWDEMTVHTVTGSTILGILRKDENQGFSHLFDWFDEEMIKFTKKTVEQELEWSDYLLKDGSIPGFNKNIGEHFVKYWADRRLKELKMQPIYNEKKSDIIDWYNRYRDINSTASALQESDSLSYQKGKLKNDLDRFSLPNSQK